MNAITVTIYNWNCWKNGNHMALDVIVNNGLLVLNDISVASAATWILLPNLVKGATTGGYTISNASIDGSAEQPNVGYQVSLGDDQTPYGSAAYCWTFWPSGNSDSNEQLWAIQNDTRGPAMDAASGGCENGTSVLLYDWKGLDNQRWLIAVS